MLAQRKEAVMTKLTGVWALTAVLLVTVAVQAPAVAAGESSGDPDVKAFGAKGDARDEYKDF